MTTQELEQLIEGQSETPNLDFKADCPWDDKTFAKDFLAMSNVRDGGTIVIGVKEESGMFVPVGVSAVNRKTYKIDEMRDQLASFCDPSPNFRVLFPKDAAGREFVVIKIEPFRDMPLLSRKGVAGFILASTVYYRNTNKRVESAAVSNSYDLREIIELAARRLIKNRTDLGYRLESGIEEIFNADVASLPKDGLLAQIRAAGHWEVEFLPTDYQEISSLRELKDKASKATVRINWPFPYYSLRPSEMEGIKNGEYYVEGFVSHTYQFELWRLYQSGHFILFRMLREDGRLLPPGYPLKGTFVNFLDSIVNFISEVVEFLSRLAGGGLYASGVNLRMTLHHVEKRILFLDDPNRSALLSPRIADANTICVTRSLAAGTLLEDPTSVSRALILEVLDNFNFKPAEDFIRSYQDRYLHTL